MTGRIEEQKTEHADNEILRQISCVKLQHVYQRNLRQPISRLPVEMLVKCLSFLTAKDKLSVIRVCRHLRAHAIDAPSLWTRVDQIHHPAALSFVLERAKSSAVDIINLRIAVKKDPRLEVINSHMNHLRILNLHIVCTGNFGIYEATFTTPAPMLQQLLIHNSGANNVYWFGLTMSLYPKLSCLQLNKVTLSGINYSNFRALQTLRTISISGIDGLGTNYLSSISSQLPELTTINLQLGNWGAYVGSDTPPLALRRINIRWTKAGVFTPAEIIPYPEAWNLVQAVHVTHALVGSGLSGNFPIAAETKPYRSLWVRTSVADSLQVHVRVVHEDGRERVFCGLHPTSVSGIATRIPGLQLTEITIATTAVALNVLSNSSWPALRRIRLVSDTYDTAWFSIFARDMFNIPTLEQIELGIDPNFVCSWKTPIALGVLGGCVAAGHTLQKVVFLGFEPDPRCVAGAEAFVDKVVVDRLWREPDDERVWFTEPAFEW